MKVYSDQRKSTIHAEKVCEAWFKEKASEGIWHIIWGLHKKNEEEEKKEDDMN